MSADELGVPEETSIEVLLKECDPTQCRSSFPAPLTKAKIGTVDALGGLHKKMESRIEVRQASGKDDHLGNTMNGAGNRFGHRIDEPFIVRAREMARSYIESNGGEYLRLAREASGEGSRGNRLLSPPN
jgi:hypothetical protein